MLTEFLNTTKRCAYRKCLTSLALVCCEEGKGAGT